MSLPSCRTLGDTLGTVLAADRNLAPIETGSYVVVPGAGAVGLGLEAGPDPTGILPLRQAFDFTRAGGHITTLGFGHST